MRKRDKVLIGFSLVVLFAGFVFLPISQFALTKASDDGGVENGVDYSVKGGELPENQSLSRYFEAGESLTVLFSDAIKGSAVPSDLPVDFLIVSPSGKSCNLTYWVATMSNPDTSLTAPPFIVWISAFDIEQIEGMTLDNSSFPHFIGKVSEDGNYTLVYKGGIAYTAIRSMALAKVTWHVDYPYSSMMPIGSALLVVGVVLSLAAVWDSRRRTRRRLSS